jgi:hypothetical protein
MVDIDHQGRQAAPVSLVVVHRVVGGIQERAAIHQIGQRIGVRELAQFLDVVVELADRVAGPQFGFSGAFLGKADAA